MNCYAYRSSSRRNCYLLVPTKDDFSKVPPEVLSQLGDLDFFKEIDLDGDAAPIALDAAAAKKSVAEKGYYVQCTKTDVTENTAR